MHITLATRVGFQNYVLHPDHRIIALAAIVDESAPLVKASTPIDHLRLEIRHANGVISQFIDLPASATVEQGIETLDTFAKVSFIGS
jgi:hypothetical protein